MVSPQAEAVVDLEAYRHNVATLAAHAPGAALMSVVKADAYGHGLRPVARAARDAGASWLGVVTVEEALALREAGDTGPVLCWLAAPGAAYGAAVEHDVELTASSVEQLDEILHDAPTGRRPRVQLKVDTGLSRNGARGPAWDELVAAASRAQAAGKVEVTGVWSHLACADEPGHPANDQQETVFRAALDVVGEAGLEPQWRHLANSAAAILSPATRFDLVRVGLAAYGLEVVTPDLQDRVEVDRVVFEEITQGVFRPASRDRYVDIMERMADRGADVVALACTEIGLLVPDGAAPLPVLDTAVVHADALADLALDPTSPLPRPAGTTSTDRSTPRETTTGRPAHLYRPPRGIKPRDPETRFRPSAPTRSSGRRRPARP